jgi:hypothetical protein
MKCVPARNLHHDAVVAALTAEGWKVTDDPLRIRVGKRDLCIDLGAEKTVLGAEKAGRKIAVEIQSFIGPSPVRDLEVAVGQYSLYRLALADGGVDRQLFMAVPQHVFESLFQEPLGRLVTSELDLQLVVFDDLAQRITQWIE